MDVRFNEESSFGQRSMPAMDVSGLMALPIRWGLAKDEAGASRILLGAAAALILVALGIWFFLRAQPPRLPGIPYEQRATLPQYVPPTR